MLKNGDKIAHQLSRAEFKMEHRGIDNSILPQVDTKQRKQWIVRGQSNGFCWNTSDNFSYGKSYVSLDDFVRKDEHESAGRTMGHVVTILNLFTTREIGGNVVTVDTARQFPTLNTSVGTPNNASLYKKGTNVGVGAMDTRGASVDVIISGNYIGLSESTYQTAIIHLQHRWGNRPVVTSGQCTASSPKRVNCSNGAGGGGGQNRRYRLRIKLDSGSYLRLVRY